MTEPADRRLHVAAPAKINLFLHCGDTRADGYHALESFVVFAEAGDVLSLAPAENLSLSLTGPFADALSGADNLVLRAAHMLAATLAAPRGAAMVLEKNLPVASGIGGGSSDAAAALRGLNALWDLGHDEAALAALGATLGADVPACVYARPLWMEGRGERITPLAPVPRLPVVLVNSGIAVPTAAVFAALNARSGLGMTRPTSIAGPWDLLAYLDDADNDLEAPAMTIAPVIGDVLAALAHEPGCVLAQMSGSGATCFGLFQEGPWAEGAAERLVADHPGWWVRQTRIAAPDIGTPRAN